MRIAQLAPTYERVPPPAYGGTENVVHLLTEELVRRGHDVTLFASGDSRTSARLRSITPRAIRYGTAHGDLRHAEYLQLANAQACFLAAADGEFDIVHNHAGIEGLVLAATSRTPVLTTNHNPFVRETQPIWDAYPWAHHALSAASAATFPAQGQLAPIHHGIDVGSFPFAPSPATTEDPYLVFLGRFMPEKGAARAIEAARRSGRTLVLAGKIDHTDADFFSSHVEPEIDDVAIRYVGEADPEAKRRLLAGADALLFPISWDEPFGLVMIESLACGTPVIGFRRASVPEVVDDGVTGFIVDDVDGMVDAIRRIPEIDRARCREAAEARFDVIRMAEDYERHYETLVGSAVAALSR
jgi:glycosyltransferase involved in cell wall biosynthesis